MRVVVLGSGVIGVASAYYLTEAGHEVVVLDRQDGPALETSFANAGEVSPGYSSPWAAPGLPLKALQWLFMYHRPLVIWPKLDPAMIAWGLRLLMNCTAARYELESKVLPDVDVAEHLGISTRELAGIIREVNDTALPGVLDLIVLHREHHDGELVREVRMMREHARRVEEAVPIARRRRRR